MDTENTPLATRDPEIWLVNLGVNRDAYLKYVLYLSGLNATPKNGKWEWCGMTFTVSRGNPELLRIAGPSGDYTGVDIPRQHDAFRLAQFKTELLDGIEYIMRVTVADDEDEAQS